MGTTVALFRRINYWENVVIFLAWYMARSLRPGGLGTLSAIFLFFFLLFLLLVDDVVYLWHTASSPTVLSFYLHFLRSLMPSFHSFFWFRWPA
jgi:hypothetical protein